MPAGRRARCGAPLLALLGLAAAAAVAGSSLAGGRRERGAPLDLDVFEDDDCREAAESEVLLALMHDMCDLLDRVLYARDEQGDRERAWLAFEEWHAGHLAAMLQLAPVVFGRPYCEPGKVAWMATECLLLLRQGERGAQEALRCAEALDEDFLTKMTPRGAKFVTRLHLMLRSPWPAFRLLDLLVRLHPESGSTRMGACRRFLNWRSDPDEFDWPWFKPTLVAAADAAAAAADAFRLRPEDGPLSRQYRARWLRMHGDVPGMREAIIFSDDVFEAYREHHYKAGCHLGVISCYILQVLLVHLRDVEGRLHRYVASVAQLINLHAPFPHMVRTDWPVFRLLHLASLLQRVPPGDVWEGDASEPRAPRDAARALVAAVERAASHGGEGRLDVVVVSAAWGAMSRFAGAAAARWVAVLGAAAALVLLALDAEALRECRAVPGARCVDAPRRLGIEGAVAKYLALAALSNLGLDALWLDLDVHLLRDPAPAVAATLAAAAQPDLVFARHLGTLSVSPAVLAVRGSATATALLMRYAEWLRENPYLLDHQGWDQFLANRAGDFAGGFDYQGRNVSVKDDKGPPHSFLPRGGLAGPGARYGTFGDEFGSGDGWCGAADASGLVFFHFWGAKESQEELFGALMGAEGGSGAGSAAHDLILGYRRVLTSAPTVSALLGRTGVRGGGGGRPLYIVAVSYADGCCAKSLRKNRRQALAVGADEARSYGRRDLGPDWAAKHKAVLSQRRGGGWWLWKPYVILKTLEDPAVPWHRGVVIWVDAGNFLHASPRPLVEQALRRSDVVALRLKWCLEVDWTSAVTLRRLNVSDRYSVTDRPQIGAYFLVLRKTELALSFVRRWLQLCEDPVALLGGEAALELRGGGEAAPVEVPGFQKHQADQSIFSVLFKEYGFHALTLEEGHRVVTLARWRQ